MSVSSLNSVSSFVAAFLSRFLSVDGAEAEAKMSSLSWLVRKIREFLKLKRLFRGQNNEIVLSFKCCFAA